jgi:hypothetical protein
LPHRGLIEMRVAVFLRCPSPLNGVPWVKRHTPRVTPVQTAYQLVA